MIWLEEQTLLVKILLVVGGSLILYIFFRYLIHLANKEAKQLNNRKSNWKENLQRLAKG